MILEVREVSRKTPADGRLEVTEATFRRLSIERELRAIVDDEQSAAMLERIACTCEAGHGGAHAHHFVRADVFRKLTPGVTCVLEITNPGVLTAARPHSLEPEAGLPDQAR